MYSESAAGEQGGDLAAQPPAREPSGRAHMYFLDVATACTSSTLRVLYNATLASTSKPNDDCINFESQPGMTGRAAANGLLRRLICCARGTAVAVAVPAHGRAARARTGTVRGRWLAGMTAAECVAMCCYFLCAVPEFVVLVALRVPTIVAVAKSKREGIH